MSLKQKGDKVLPTKKSEVFILYDQWDDRKPLTFEYDHGLWLPKLMMMMMPISSIM